MVKIKKGKNNSLFGFFSKFINIILFLLILTFIFYTLEQSRSKIKEITFSELVEQISQNNVSEILDQESNLTIIYKNNTEFKFVTKKDSSSSLEEVLISRGLGVNQINGFNHKIQSPTGFAYYFKILAPIFIPFILILLIFWLFFGQIKNSTSSTFNFGKSRAIFIDPKDKNKKVLFKDIAGLIEAKNELREIVSFLKNPKKYLEIGATIPKGVILTGPPGTGKTLLARAVSGEANVPFFSISASDFIEMFVGVGASRVRDLFKNAKKVSPSIIFIDELDSIGRSRGQGFGGGNDEREQTLNQILVELDGFIPSDRVIVIAATNREQILDKALLRSGRFDRKIKVDYPTFKDRIDILKVHLKNKKQEEKIDLNLVAKRIPGFSGADIYNLVNESAILAAGEDRKKVSEQDLLNSIEKVLLGPEIKSKIFSPEEIKLIAFHESGHALVGSLLKDADLVHKISIIPRGDAGGYTLNLPEKERKLKDKKYFLAQIKVLLAGYAVEEFFFKTVSTGPSNDLKVASSIARSMISYFGMGEKIGAVSFAELNKTNDYSEKITGLIDQEIFDIITSSLEEVKKIISKHKDIIEIIANQLIEKEILEKEEYEKILLSNNIELNSI